MLERTANPVPRWPFVTAGALLFAFGVLIVFRNAPLNGWEVLGCALCAALGTGCSILPYTLEHRRAGKLAETAKLNDIVSQLAKIEQLGAQIGYFTNQWQVVRESCDKTAGAAKEIVRSMAGEIKTFSELRQRADDSEKATLRLEIDKLRRTESEWLQTTVRMLDHVHAVTHAAQRSQQSGVADQLVRFQHACHNAARRVGLIPFTAERGEHFKPERHELVEGKPESAVGAQIDEVVASGFMFQGRLIRPVLVRVRQGNDPAAREAMSTGATGAT